VKKPPAHHRARTRVGVLWHRRNGACWGRLRLLTTCVGIHFCINNQDVHVVRFKSFNVIQATKSNIISPSVSASDPLRQLRKHVSLRPDPGQQRWHGCIFLVRQQRQQQWFHLIEKSSALVGLMITNIEPIHEQGYKLLLLFGS